MIGQRLVNCSIVTKPRRRIADQLRIVIAGRPRDPGASAVNQRMESGEQAVASAEDQAKGQQPAIASRRCARRR